MTINKNTRWEFTLFYLIYKLQIIQSYLIKKRTPSLTTKQQPYLYSSYRQGIIL